MNPLLSTDALSFSIKRNVLFAYVILLLLLGVSGVEGGPLGTAIAYQGRLTDGTNAANGVYDLRISAFDAVGGGNQIGSTVTISNVPMTDGRFTVEVDLGTGVFSDQERWLALEV